MIKRRNHVAILGATGSIGTAAADVLLHLSQIDPHGNWRLWAASGHRNISLLADLAGKFAPPPKLVCSCPSAVDHYANMQNVADRFDTTVGPHGLVDLALSKDVDTVVAAIVGRAGLESTLAAIDTGKRVALANKETMVIAGPLVRQAMRFSGAEVLPVDSEHSAIFQCLGNWASPTIQDQSETHEASGVASLAATASQQRPCRFAPGEDHPADDRGADRGTSDPPAQHQRHQAPPKPNKLILTASGGPFRTWDRDQIASATAKDALAHPTWNMGRKITVDSATMMNKALEVIEARWLFDVPAESIEVVVHPQSIIHSMVEFDDGSVIAQMSPPDMRLPIQYALTYPDRLPSQSPPLRRDVTQQLTLEPADRGRFPALSLGFEVAEVGGTAGAVVNAANEQAVGLFLDGKIRFTDIVAGCRDVLENHTYEKNPTLERLLELDQWARAEIDRRFR